MNIYEKLMNIQNELKAPKGQYNSFGKYKYRNCEDILEAVKPIAKKYGTVVIVSDDLVLIGDRYYIRAEAKIFDIETGEYTYNNAYAREELEKKGMDASQITGTASSYARKYALNGLLSIDDTKDADTDEHKNQTQGKVDEVEEIEKKLVDKVNIAAMQAEMLRTGVKPQQILMKYNAGSLESLNKKQFVEIMQVFSKTPDKEK